MARCGRPEIIGTDQGIQFTSPRFIGLLQQARVHSWMAGRDHWMGQGVHRAVVRG